MTIRSKLPSKEYEDGWDRIFGTKKKEQADKQSDSQLPLFREDDWQDAGNECKECGE